MPAGLSPRPGRRLFMRDNVDAGTDSLSSDFRLCSCGWRSVGRRRWREVMVVTDSTRCDRNEFNIGRGDVPHQICRFFTDFATKHKYDQAIENL
jgi:hypothetical protein